MFELIKKVFIAILSSSKLIANDSDFTKWILLNNQQFITKPNLIDLNPDEYNQKLRYYRFTVNLDKFSGSCNIPYDLSDRICVPNN